MTPSVAEIKHNVSLKPFNTLALDAKAEHLAFVTHCEQIPHLVAEYGKPSLVMGGGSNLVIADDVPGLVIVNQIKGRDLSELGKDNFLLSVGAGENWDELVRWSCAQRLWGIENLGMIPGTAGAAPMQNIGAYGVEIESVLLWLEALELATGKVKRFSNSECGFAYRHSVFKGSLKNQFVITRVGLQLSKKPNPILTYEPLRQRIGPQAEPIAHPRTIYDTVCSIRSSKLPDPGQLANAGSFFKNPIIDEVHHQYLLQQHRQLPCYPAEQGRVKVAAGWLIEQAGWKGKRCGSVGVHENQALVLVNYNHGTAQELLALAKKIVDDVYDKFGIEREVEPMLVCN